MNSYSTSEECITNITEKTDESNERIDLGQEFLSQTSAETDPKIDTSVGPLNQFCYNNQTFVQFGQPFVSIEGFISLFVSKEIRVDINSNHSVCVTTPLSKASFDQMGHNIGLIHPYGRVFQESEQNSIHIESSIHLAKMCDRGVTFTSLNRSLIYLVDSSGCKTTTERFRKLSYDFTADIFHANSLTGDYARQRAFAALLRGSYEVSKDGNEKIWNVAGFKVRYNSLTGNIIIDRSWKLMIQLNQNSNQLKISSPYLRIIANNSTESCLRVIRPNLRDEQRVVVSFNRFQVKNGSQKAGFDANDELFLM